MNWQLLFNKLVQGYMTSFSFQKRIGSKLLILKSIRADF